MATAATKTKKRSSTSQDGPRAKKFIADKSNRPTAVGSREKQRSRPVTQAILVEDENEDDWEDEGDEIVEDELAGIEEDNEMGNNRMDVDSRPPKDPNAARESHKAQRELLQQRRAAKPHSSLLTEAKRAWILAHKKDLPAPERRKNVAALMSIIQGHVKDVVLKHDASRIVQTVVKHGTPAERNQIAVELKGKYKELAQNRYSKFLVTKLIRLCPTHRASILSEFQGQIIRLLLHREASSVLADAFELHANAYERSLLLRDFYGREINLFSVTTGSDADKERAKRGLQGVLEGVDGERRRRVMAAIKESLITVFNNPDKGAITHAIVHRALWEYLMAVSDTADEVEQEKLRREIYESCQDVLAEMVHTRDGSRVVREFIAHGTAKDRKHIVKTLKPHVERMCQSDEPQLVLFSALDIIDDTKLTAKSLVADIVSHAPTLYTTAQGRRALLYPLAPRSRRHLLPAHVAELAETDSVRARTSKKDPDVRVEELRVAASESLIDWITRDGASVAQDTGGSLVVTEVMLTADGDKTKAIQTLLTPVSAEYPSSDLSAPHPLDLPHMGRMYKTLLQGGHFSRENQNIESSKHWEPAKFADAWVSTVGKDVTLAAARAGGTFVVAELVERLLRDGSAETKKMVKEWFKPIRKEIKAWDAKGSQVLAEKVDALFA